MTPDVGFVVLTHAHPGQVSRLVDRLRRLYGPSAPIVVHHDQHQCPLHPAQVPGARLVEPSLRTAWGSWSLVEATLAALRLLHRDGGPGYTVLLSGADYPVSTAARVLDDLRTCGGDAYLRAHPVHPWRRDRRAAPGPLGFGANEGPSNQEICYRRYYSTTFGWRRLRLRIRSPLLAPLLSPFSAALRPFAGDQWWTLGRTAVAALLASQRDRPDLVRWFAERQIPDEAYIQTVVTNAPGVRVVPRNFRYLHWADRPGPRTLDLEDLPRIQRSGDHFARKFTPDHPVLDRLDEQLGLPPWRPGRSERAAAP